VPAASSDRGTARLEVTLFGPAWRLYPWVLAALAEALRRGIGKTRQVWVLREVYRIQRDGELERLAGGDLTALSATVRPDLLGLSIEPHLARQPVAIDLLSPARLLRDGRLLPGAEPVPLALVVARILDRFADLYGGEASEILRREIRAVVEAEAERVPVLVDGTRWVEVHDYSARGRSELLLGGKVGRVVYGGEAARFLPILRSGEILHVGKNAASGCGRIKVELPPLRESATATSDGAR
jgi:hypothetical protein